MPALQVTDEDLIAVAKNWGIRTATATRLISELAQAVLAAIDTTAALIKTGVFDVLEGRIRGVHPSCAVTHDT